MLFAAGFGTRMKHLTADQPKPLVKVSGKALIDHTLEIARGIAPETILANLHYLPHMLVEHLADTGVQTILETPKILETGGGLRNALPILGDAPVITMNTDTIWSGPNPVKMVLDAWNPSQMDALLVCVPVSKTVGYSGNGDFEIDANSRLLRGNSSVYGGVQIIKTDRLAAVSETAFSLNVIWNQMLKDERLFGINYTGNWCDVGHPDGIKLAEGMLNV